MYKCHTAAVGADFVTGIVENIKLYVMIRRMTRTSVKFDERFNDDTSILAGVLTTNVLDLSLRVLLQFESYYSDLTNPNTIALTITLCTSVSMNTLTLDLSDLFGLAYITVKNRR